MEYLHLLSSANIEDPDLVIAKFILEKYLKNYY